MGMLGMQGLHWYLSFSAVTSAFGSSIGVRCGVPSWPPLSLLSATAPSSLPLICSWYLHGCPSPTTPKLTRFCPGCLGTTGGSGSGQGWC